MRDTCHDRIVMNNRSMLSLRLGMGLLRPEASSAAALLRDNRHQK